MINDAARDPARTISDSLAAIHRLSPAGFAIALHHRLQSPLYRFTTGPERWAKAYAARNLMLGDPTWHWALRTTGRVAWSELAGDDESGVLALAAEHGLRHGMTIAVAQGGTRSIAQIARGDRELDPSEGEEAEAALVALHDATHPDAGLDAAQREVLRRLSVAFTGW